MNWSHRARASKPRKGVCNTVEHFGNPQRMDVLVTRVYRNLLGNSSSVVSQNQCINYQFIPHSIQGRPNWSSYSIQLSLFSHIKYGRWRYTASWATKCASDPTQTEWAKTWASILEQFPCYISPIGHCTTTDCIWSTCHSNFSKSACMAFCSKWNSHSAFMGHISQVSCLISGSNRQLNRTNI